MKRMEEKQFGEKEKEPNYIPNQQSLIDEKNSCSIEKVFSSHEKEGIVTLEQEQREEIQINSVNLTSEKDIELKSPCATEHTIIREVKCAKVVYDKLSDEKAEIVEKVHAAKDNNDLNNDQINASQTHV